MRPPIDAKRSGSFRKSTISWTSSFASSTPATSANVTVTSCGSIVRAFSSVGTRPVTRTEQREAGEAEQQQTKRHRAVTARRVRLFACLHVEADAALRQVGDKRRIRGDVALRRNRHPARAISELELEHILRLRDVTDAAGMDVVQEIGKRRDRPAPTARRAGADRRSRRKE